ncbi:MAG: chemotaxis response regulator CheY [Desulfobacterales bacterium]|nr:chemotaxis response regulator CheY [Desulfobacterales bacterium]
MDLNMKVLVVDDFATMRRILKNILKQIGFKNIIEADDGSTALDILKENKIDLVISDWNMPRITGLDLLKTVRADESTKDTPFVMVTAEAQKANVLQAVQAGVSNYVVKPFTADTVREKLAQVFK